MKFEDPNEVSEEDMKAKFEALYNDISETFRRMQE
jgi:V-type H+-transporting ATPase subunit A